VKVKPPLPPEGEGQEPPRTGNGNGDAPPTLQCPHCRIKEYTPARLAEHVDIFHTPDLVAADDDDSF
jgi:hypothetical protein